MEMASSIVQHNTGQLLLMKTVCRTRNAWMFRTLAPAHATKHSEFRLINS